MARPKALPKGTVTYYDEDQPQVRWIAGLREIRAWEKQGGKTMEQIGTADDMLFLAYKSLERDGKLPIDSTTQQPVSYEAWADTVMWLSDDEDDSAGEAKPPAA